MTILLGHKSNDMEEANTDAVRGGVAEAEPIANPSSWEEITKARNRSRS